jgi:hypothetical protein
MPRIFDNIEKQLLAALRETLNVSDRADFCVGYFNLRGWKQLDSHIEKWAGGKDNCCRLLVGMQRLPQEELISALSLVKADKEIDQQTALRIKKKLAEEFREQLTYGIPTNDDEAGLRRLAAQIKAKKVVVKLFLRHQLHAKLYLLFRPDPINPTIGYMGSSNLTFAGLAQQGELNIDVLDHDASQKLTKWFEDRWNDRWCLDISDDLVSIIEESWARDLKNHAYRKECNYKATGKVIYDEFYPKYSKPIIDEIDRVLAKHYGVTDEELDFIINYDIKYRMGRESGEGE